MTFNVSLATAADLRGPLAGKAVTLDFGDGSPAVTLVTAMDGSASAMHTYAAAGTFNATATFAGTIPRPSENRCLGD